MHTSASAKIIAVCLLYLFAVAGFLGLIYLSGMNTPVGNSPFSLYNYATALVLALFPLSYPAYLMFFKKRAGADRLSD